MKYIKLFDSFNFRDKALNFIKNYLDIKSNVILINKSSKLNFDKLEQEMAHVGFPVNGNFTIEINFNDTKFGFVRRLAHEMVHVKQIEDGRLSKIDNNSFSFDGKAINFVDYKNKYHDELPKFEEEAFELEKIIANNFWEDNL